MLVCDVLKLQFVWSILPHSGYFILCLCFFLYLCFICSNIWEFSCLKSTFYLLIEGATFRKKKMLEVCFSFSIKQLNQPFNTLHFCLSLSPSGDTPGCLIRSVIPAWFSELSARADVLRAAWSITLCLSLIHSTCIRVGVRVCTGVCSWVWAQRDGGLKLKRAWL